MHTKFKRQPVLRNLTSMSPVFSSLIHEVLNTPIQGGLKDQEKRYSTPPANIVEYEDKFEVSIALPGFTKNQVQVNAENNQLVITAEKPADEKEVKALYKEFFSENYKRVFSITDKISKENITASFNDGILVVSLKKAEEAKPKSISIL